MRAEQCKMDLTAWDKMKWQMQENENQGKKELAVESVCREINEED